ncbi:phage portal protein [Bifidobacterium simiiventris]|uniref:phage portal protein n=1 Tax=Bifidobacterium simiiventris TaxID=2834434 RepID=UPI001C5869CE|nr:phage portal protein [Bifidobacterium simiiventris]MBW3077697.1 phage portal protein [Bifidobacterium simiiventris]
MANIDGRTVTIRNNVTGVRGESAERLYQTQPHLRTVISFLASNVAQLPLKCYRRNADNDRERDCDSILYRLLREPNPDMTGYELVYALVSDLKLYDNAYWWIIPAKNVTPSGWLIRPIPPSWILSYTDTSGFGFDTLTFSNPYNANPPITIPARQLLVFHGWNPADPRMGNSPVDALKQILAEQYDAWKFREQVWRNGGRFDKYISRPANVQPWTDAQAERFKTEMQEKWTGDSGSNAGKMPVLEDGMTINSAAFNAREAQWLETTKLSLQTVASVYHLNPTMVGATEGATYANVREYARMLYTDTLGPDLRMIADRINMRLLPMLGMSDDEYVEFDIQAKLSGNFEDQASQIQSSVGAPWMTRNEARALANLPRIDGGDDIVTPLNVLIGGQASPTDSGDGITPADPYANAGHALTVIGQMINGKQATPINAKTATPPRKARGHPGKEQADEIADTLKRFFKRQRDSVLAAIGAKHGEHSFKSDETPDWWDAARWDRELADDLRPFMVSQSTQAARMALENLGIDPDSYDEARTVAYLTDMAEGRAHGINQVTLRQLVTAITGGLDDDAEKHDPAGVFAAAIGARAAKAAVGIATAVSGWGTLEACRQKAPASTVKTWIVTSSNPRPSHAAMNGQTVAYRKPFSNGADWPGDKNALGIDEIAGCTCEVEVTIP